MYSNVYCCPLDNGGKCANGVYLLEEYMSTAAHFKVEFADYQEGGDLTDE